MARVTWQDCLNDDVLVFWACGDAFFPREKILLLFFVFFNTANSRLRIKNEGGVSEREGVKSSC